MKENITLKNLENIDFCFTIKGNSGNLSTATYQWNKEEGLPCEEKILEDAEPDCYGDCLNESQNHCECNPCFDEGRIVGCTINLSKALDVEKLALFLKGTVLFSKSSLGDSTIKTDITLASFHIKDKYLVVLAQAIIDNANSLFKEVV